MKEILLNRMYVGEWLIKNIGHEVINLFKADNDKNYIYVTKSGTLDKKHKEIETVLLVQGVSANTVEIIAKAEVVESIWNMPDEERIKKQNEIKYGGVSLNEILPDIKVTFEVKNVLYPEKKNIYYHR